MRRIALGLALALIAASPAAASTERSRGLVAALERLDQRLTGTLDAAQRRAVHSEKAELIGRFFEGRDQIVIATLDCAATSLQQARRSRARAHFRSATTCVRRLAASVPKSAALGRLQRDLRAIGARIRAGRVFGSLATATTRSTSRCASRSRGRSRTAACW